MTYTVRPILHVNQKLTCQKAMSDCSLFESFTCAVSVLCFSSSYNYSCLFMSAHTSNLIAHTILSRLIGVTVQLSISNQKTPGSPLEFCFISYRTFSLQTICYRRKLSPATTILYILYTFQNYI